MSDLKSTSHSARAKQESDYLEEQNKYRARVKAARIYAHNAAGEDKLKFIGAFLTALHADTVSMPAEQTQEHLISEISKLKMPLLPEQLYSDSIYLENIMKWINFKEFILGGALTQDFPDCVAIGELGRYCSGTLIAPNIVLTAGHCAGYPRLVHAGANIGDREPIYAKEVVRYPAYDVNSKLNDLAIFFLKDEIQIAKYPKLAESKMIDDAHEICIVGFGYNDPVGKSGLGNKRVAKVPIKSYNCTIADRRVFDCHVGVELVAQAPNYNIDTCDGDSGGPAYVQRPGDAAWYLAAVTSRGIVGEPCGHGGIYVRVDVAQYKDWIDKSIEGGIQASRNWQPS